MVCISSDIMEWPSNPYAKAAIMDFELTALGWHIVIISDRSRITEEWCNANIKGNYDFSIRRWYFEDSKDATWFTLWWAGK